MSAGQEGNSTELWALMANYYPLLARGIAGLRDNSAESRRTFYERAQCALVDQLRQLDPPLEEPELLRERLSLEDAVRKVEAQFAGPGGAPFSGQRRARRAVTAPRCTERPGAPAKEDAASNRLRGVDDTAPAGPDGLHMPGKPVRPRRRILDVVAGIIAWLVVAAIVAAGVAMFEYRDEIKAWFGIEPSAARPRVTASSPPKISDRIGPGKPRAQAWSADSAALYEDDPYDKHGKRYRGSVNWKTETVSSQATSPELTIRGSLEVPERHLRMALSIRRNLDRNLPASHTIEIAVQADAELGEISDIPALLMKSEEQADGARLTTVTARVTSGLFLIGLSAAAGDFDQNLKMLKEQSWFDMPFVYKDGRRAILAIEKGATGNRAFEEAFGAWGE
jgi:hypothetical protein